MRSCVGCRTNRPKADLVRVVRTPTGDLRLDETGRLNGRGAYLCRDSQCWQSALSKGQIARALGTPVPPELRSVLEAGPLTMTQGGAHGQE